MTAQVIPIPDRSASIDTVARAAASKPANVFLLALSTLWVYAAPRAAGRLWLRGSLPAASAVAIVHLAIAAFWCWAVLVAAYVCLNGNLFDYTHHYHPEALSLAAAQLRTAWRDAFHTMMPLDRVAAVLTAGMFTLGAIVVPFFMLLPFGARPGPSRPCIRHVSRTVLLGLGSVHLWGLGLTATFFAVAAMPHDIRGLEYQRALSPVLLVSMGLLLWIGASLVAAVRLDYRRPVDGPEPHDPWCDVCGYNLIATDTDSRCPECGRPVIDSVGEHTRPPLPWEQHPSLARLGIIVQQFKKLVRHPRRLFFSMPTLTGQRAAQRWLLFSLVPIGLIAGLTIPAMHWVRGAEWSWDLLTGGMAMGLVWSLLALMMVGIETAGIATFSRMRSKAQGQGRGVYLATAAKATCYSSILMIAWAFLGGIQLLAAMWWFDHNGRFLFHPPLSLRTEQIILALSLAAAHIGGLLWYELTVYGGIRGIQYANK